MSNTQHPSNRWSWVNSNMAKGRLGRLFGDGDLILDCRDFIYGKPEHARLIAAAPDLLGVLEIVAKGIRSGHIEDQTLISGDKMQPLSEMVDAAIAKARSQQ